MLTTICLTAYAVIMYGLGIKFFQPFIPRKHLQALVGALLIWLFSPISVPVMFLLLLAAA